MLRDAERIIGNPTDKQSVSLISSVDENGFPNIRAMLPPRKRGGIQAFYFITNTSSMRVSRYCSNSKACTCFCDKRSFRKVMLIGVIEVLEDVAGKEAVWQKGDMRYHSKGAINPDYYVLKLAASAGRYYANFKSENLLIK